MQTKKIKKKGNQRIPVRCPYCGANVVFRSADGIYKENRNRTMLYVCSRYPECDAYVRAQQGTRVPLGSMADHRLRKLRCAAHEHFDILYKSGRMSQKDAYQWLADVLDAPMSEAHIGHMGEYYCEQVIKKSRELMAGWEKQERLAKKRKQGRRDGGAGDGGTACMMGGAEDAVKCRTETESGRKCGAGA